MIWKTCQNVTKTGSVIFKPKRWKRDFEFKIANLKMVKENFRQIQSNICLKKLTSISIGEII